VLQQSRFLLITIRLEAFSTCIDQAAQQDMALALAWSDGPFEPSAGRSIGSTLRALLESRPDVARGAAFVCL
jgi:hypothetical protein